MMKKKNYMTPVLEVNDLHSTAILAGSAERTETQESDGETKDPTSFAKQITTIFVSD